MRSNASHAVERRSSCAARPGPDRNHQGCAKDGYGPPFGPPAIQEGLTEGPFVFLGGEAGIDSGLERFALRCPAPLQVRTFRARKGVRGTSRSRRPASQAEYLQALAWVRDGGWSGPKIYDALLLACAAQCPVQRIYTFNLSDFQLLAPATLPEKICAP